MKKSGAQLTAGPRAAESAVVRELNRSRVAVAACATYSPSDVESALAEIMEAIGGLSAFVKPGHTVLIKPNLFSPHPPDHAVTTHPELVRQVIGLCAKAGATRIWVGDSPVGMPLEEELWSHTGMTAAVAGTSGRLKSWRVKQIPLPCGDDFLAVPEWYPEVDAIISLPKLKTHSLTTMTCGLKNVYGIVSGPAKSQFHVKYPSPLAMGEFLVRVFAAVKPCLTIADAVVAMEGNGPAHGSPLPVGVLLAGRDAVALDAVACRALRISPEAVAMIRLASAGDLGRMVDSEIECMGSGVSLLQSAALRPSFARYLRRIPEPFFRISTRPWRLRPKIKNRLCEKCGACIEACPKNAITNHPRNGYPHIDKSVCIDCFCCAESCPESAIAVQLYLGNLIPIASQKRRKVAAK